MPEFQPLAGQVALIEGSAVGPVTGVVVRDEPFTVDVPERSIPRSSEVDVTICGAGVRWAARGCALPLSDGRVVIEGLVKIEPSERRAHRRRPVRMGVTVMTGDDADVAHTVDLSVGGVRIEMPHRLAVGNQPTLILPLPGGAPVMAVAEVLDAQECGDGWKCRLVFRNLRKLDVQRLSAFVDSPSLHEDRHRR